MRHAELYQRLLEIPEDRYVMHGSPYELEIIEPRRTGRDDVPAYNHLGVYATTCIEIALLYATIHTKRTEWGFAPQTTTSTLDVRVPLGFIHGPGFVHILPKEGFEELTLAAFVSHKPVRPVEVFPIDRDVLFEMIENRTVEVGIYDPASA